MSTKITYNDVPTSLEAGKAATLECNGKKMKSDIVVVFGSNGSIAYNGTQTSVESGKTATVQCAGKKMLTDLMVVTDMVVADELAGTWLLNESVGTVEPKAWVLCTLDGYFNGIVSKTFELQEIPLKQIYLGNGGGVFYIQLCSDACGYPISKATSGYPISSTGYYAYAGNAKAGWECDYHSSKTDYVFFTENNYIASLDDKGHYCEDISQDNVPLRTFTITTTLAEYTKREPEEAELLMKWLKNNATKLS